MTVLPGLIDCHDHMANHSYDTARQANEKSTPVHGRNGTLTRAERNPGHPGQRGGFARAA